MIIPYQKDLKVSNMGSMKPGSGARYLECVQSHEGTLIAKQWRRTVPKKYEVLVDFKAREEQQCTR